MSTGLGINQFRPAPAAALADEMPGVATPGVATPGISTPEAYMASEKADLAAQADLAPAKALGALQISDPHGAPAIAPVNKDFAIERMMLELQKVKLKSQEGQLRTASEGMAVDGLNRDQYKQNALAKLQEANDKGESAEAKSKYAKIFSWAAKIGAFAGSLLAVAGSLAAVVLSGGAAAPLLVLAVTGLVSSSISLISAIRQERGGEPLDINIGVTMACKALLTQVGVPEEKLEAASKIMAGSLGIITGAVVLDPQLFGSLASGVVLMSTGNENWAAVAAAGVTAYTTMALAAVMCIANPGSASTQVQKAMAQIPQLANTIKHALSAVSAAGSGISALINIGVSFDEHGAAMAQVDRQKFSNLITKLQAQMTKDSEQITEIVKDIQQSMSQVSKMIMQAGESRAQIIANLGRFMA